MGASLRVYTGAGVGHALRVEPLAVPFMPVLARLHWGAPENQQTLMAL